MDSSRKRSASVIAAAVVAILGSLFLLLCCSAVFFMTLLVKLPNPPSELPPSVRAFSLGAQGFMICLSLFGIATGIGLLYLRKWARISILNLVFLPLFSFQFPIFIFGRVLHGLAGLAVLISSCLAFFVAGIGLLKLKPWSYSLTIGLQLFWLASTVVTLLTPNYKAEMDSFIKEIQASMHLPETQFSQGSFSQNYGWAVILGLVVAGAILGMLVYYRPRFLEAASRASAAS